jgi:hypothetical protein
MNGTVDPEELADKDAVAKFLDIHLQDAQTLVITKVTGKPFQYLAELTADDPGAGGADV